MKKFVFTLVGLIGCILLVLVCAEGLLRLSYRIVSDPSLEVRTRYMQSLNATIYRLWNSGPKDDPFLPPLQVFGNQDSSDQIRLSDIARRSKLPPSATFQSYDFLQFDREPSDTRYIVHTNSLGFRGPERSSAKPKGVYRIILLGSYSSFGLGVNDEETLSHQLEEMLNRRAPRGRRYEVWNGGRPAGTAIVGLARLQFEVLAYKPDLVIVNYGFMDGTTFGDHFLLSAMHIPKNVGTTLVRAALMPFLAFFEHSYLAGRIGEAIDFTQFKRNMELYYEAMGKIDQFCREKRVPLLVLNAQGAPNVPEAYVKSRQLNTWSIFVEHPPTPAQFAARENSWVSKVPTDALFQRLFAFYPYRLNAYQLNKVGYKTIAEALVPEIENLGKHETH